MRKILAVLLVLFLVACTTPTPVPTLIYPTPRLVIPTPTAIPTLTPIPIRPFEINGIGSMNTPPFTIPTREWQITWDFADYVAGFFVYPRGETAMYIESISWPGNQGSTYVYKGQGEFYIKVLAMGNWRLKIQPIEK